MRPFHPSQICLAVSSFLLGLFGDSSEQGWRLALVIFFAGSSLWFMVGARRQCRGRVVWDGVFVTTFVWAIGTFAVGAGVSWLFSRW